MLTELEARDIAQKVVNAAKATAHVDTGALRRSISFTYVRGEIIFRQLFYGVFYDNSRLEKYAQQYIPSDQKWKLITTNFGGETVEVGRTQSGRATKRILKPYSRTSRQSSSNINKLIAISKAKSNGEKKNT